MPDRGWTAAPPLRCGLPSWPTPWRLRRPRGPCRVLEHGFTEPDRTQPAGGTAPRRTAERCREHDRQPPRSLQGPPEPGSPPGGTSRRPPPRDASERDQVAPEAASPTRRVPCAAGEPPAVPGVRVPTGVRDAPAPRPQAAHPSPQAPSFVPGAAAPPDPEASTSSPASDDPTSPQRTTRRQGFPDRVRRDMA
jgi:hypothetical protein